MITVEKVKESLGPIKEPFLHLTLAELNAIEEIKVKEEKNHVSVKIAITKTGTPEQMQLQTQIVNTLKEAGADTVGIRFGELPAEVVEKYRSERKAIKRIKDCYQKIIRQLLLRLRVVKVE